MNLRLSKGVKDMEQEIPTATRIPSASPRGFGSSVPQPDGFSVYISMPRSYKALGFTWSSGGDIQGRGDAHLLPSLGVSYSSKLMSIPWVMSEPTPHFHKYSLDANCCHRGRRRMKKDGGKEKPSHLGFRLNFGIK